jgi:hypothetical protein
MKKAAIIYIAFIILSPLAFAHRQHVHQFISAEAYSLLRLHVGGDIPNMVDGNEVFIVGNDNYKAIIIQGK